MITGASFADIVAIALALATIAASALLGDHTLARRALAVIAVMMGTMILVSALLRATPGDPIESILGEQAPASSRQALAKELGLVDDRGAPIGVVAQVGRFMRGAASAALLTITPASLEAPVSAALASEPRSFRTGEPVRKIVLARLPNTLLLAGASLAVAVVLGIGLGALAAARRRSFIGRAADAVALAGVAMPRFWLAPLLILVFSLKLRWVPPSGADEGVRSLILPALSLGTALAALLARMTRAQLIDALASDHVRTARAKGLDERRVVIKHALPQALLPVVTLIGLQVGGLLAGAVVTEKVFSWPGIGLLLVESIRKLDVPVVQGVVLVTALGAALSTLAAEAVVRVLDPRLRAR